MGLRAAAASVDVMHTRHHIHIMPTLWWTAEFRATLLQPLLYSDRMWMMLARSSLLLSQSMADPPRAMGIITLSNHRPGGTACTESAVNTFNTRIASSCTLGRGMRGVESD